MTANSFVSPQTPIAYSAVATAAETTFNNPTNVVEVIPPGDNTAGMRLTKVYSINRGARGGTTTIAWYEKDASTSPPTYTLIDSVSIADNTPSSSVASTKADLGLSEENPIILKAGKGLAFSTGRAVTGGEVGRAEGGAY